MKAEEFLSNLRAIKAEDPRLGATIEWISLGIASASELLAKLEERLAALEARREA